MGGIRISVCLASYNGEEYIREQLESILPQLSENDEVIISDDHSTDNTLKIIEGIKDHRIKIYQNENGKGPIKNFENAISKASGDFIFLSDQDDIWKENKVQKIMSVFDSDQELTLVFSNAEFIDKNGKKTGTNFFNRKVPEKSLLHHYVKPEFLGCTVAFKNKVIPKLLPFPDKIPMHDWWIGMMHIYYGKVKYLPEILISYRRHGNNVTSTKRSKLPIIIKWRVNFLFNFVGTILK
ncbi:MAG: glycosyltransferase family 2 protein [Chryseobacterium sp.]|jgi:glycosyltransferase involved in cell wall biosynthesis|uniref:glycosyltransferase family 2 protein n=1 Tax=Chryseobacterium sp. TaxID=1871047 RepID=UPI00282DB470|nr:glycosyltransferase family 2 protein [Chryseobacterium sp.]MDR2236521.1 glycosyltransferase family 2 protein [Chryseobacterium sp.]